MATAQEILQELAALGKESYKRVMMRNHGVREPYYGVAIGDMQPIRKRIRKDYQLALDLYETGNYDAMYLAGLIADDARMTCKDLQRWVEAAYAGALPGSTVAAVAAGSSHGHEMALKWVESPQEHIAAAGWATFSSLVSILPDERLDLAELAALLERVKRDLPTSADKVKYQMNGFIICVGSYVPTLTATALRIAEEMGPVQADLGENDCQMPYAPDYIRKVMARGTLGKKRKSAKC